MPAKKTHCPQGHPYAGDNLFFVRGAQACRTCYRERSRRAYAEKRTSFHRKQALRTTRYNRDLNDRFDENYVVDPVSGCWNWTGSKTVQGYGRMAKGHNLITIKAHRFSYIKFKGPIPEGLVIDHLCRNHACVNPEHLEAVTDKINILRGISVAAQNAKKVICKRGHVLQGDNLMLVHRPTGNVERRCRACHKLHAAAFKQGISISRMAA